MIKTVQEFLNEVNSRWPDRAYGRWVVFRGQRDSTWPLVPSIGRQPFTEEAIQNVADDRQPVERHLLIAFERHCLGMLPSWVRDGSETERSWKILAVAQHYRLPTRLLDWSSNPLVALFFALEEEPNGSTPGVFVLDSIKESTTVSGIARRPENGKAPLYNYNDIALVNPPHLDGRVIAQGSMFTVGKTPSNPVPATRIEFDPDYRDEGLKELNAVGVNRATLFPDLEGAAIYLKWSCQHWAGDVVKGVE